jgi:poly(A) polymerase
VNTIIAFIKKLLRKKKIAKLNIDKSYVIERHHHHVSKTEISENALTVVNRLSHAGFQAYVVGGGVRDLLLRHSPKDFDVATSATPNEIKKLFRNARIIGRRFKLVHILFHREIIEVATFRGTENHAQSAQQKTNERGMLVRDNVYGTLEEDAWRRDFTINSLYYDAATSSIIDFTGGAADIQKKLIRMIGEPEMRYAEDPVRMIRAIRFSAKLKFDIEAHTAAPIHTLSHLIEHVSNSRMFDEIVKLYHCGAAETVQRLLIHYGLFQRLFPLTAALSHEHHVNALIVLALENTDARLKNNKPVTPAFLFAVLLWFPLKKIMQERQTEESLEPLNALEQAMSIVLTEQCRVTMIPKRFTQVIREMWLLQFLFEKRTGQRAYQLLEHPRFRAAFDLLALRALCGDESMALADWWTTFQDSDPKTQEKMIDAVKSKSTTSKSKPKRSKNQS